MSGNTGITDFERENQQRAMESHAQDHENPDILTRIGDKARDMTEQMGSTQQEARDGVHETLKGKHSSEQGEGTLDAGAHQEDKTLPTKVMRDGAEDEQAADVNKNEQTKQGAQ